MCLPRCKSHNLGTAVKGCRQVRDQHIHDHADQFRKCHGTDNPERRAFFCPVILPCAQILPDKRCECHRKTGNRQEGKTFDLGIHTAACDCHHAKLVNIGLHHDVGNRNNRVLQTGGQTKADNLPKLRRMKPDLPYFYLINIVRAHQPDKTEQRTRRL